MDFNPLLTQNWSRTFSVWIQDIQVQFQPAVRITLNGGFLRRVRGLTRVSAGLVALFFLLHCSRPQVAAAVPRHPEEEPRNPASQDEGASETGGASWYGGKPDRLSGRRTASGEPLDPSALTCAHRTLPMGSYVQVENLENGRRAVMRINDRGPFIQGRIVDVTRRGAEDLGFLEQGLTKVRVRPVQQDGSKMPSAPKMEVDNPYTIQVAALTEPANIERLSKELKEFYGSVALKSATDREGRPVTRVQAGSYMTMEEAEKASREIAKRFGDRGVEPFITRRR